MKEGYLFILRELAQFCSFISSQHALHMAGRRVNIEIKCYFMCF